MIDYGGREGEHFSSFAAAAAAASGMMMLAVLAVEALVKVGRFLHVVLQVQGGGVVVLLLRLAVATAATAAAVVLLFADGLQHGGDVTELVDDVEHALALARRHFLRVAGKRDRLEVVVRQVDVTQRRVGNVFDVRPADAELAAEPVVRPDARFAGEVDATDHLRDSAKLATVIHAEQEDSGSVMMMVLVGMVQFLVPVVR